MATPRPPPPASSRSAGMRTPMRRTTTSSSSMTPLHTPLAVRIATARARERAAAAAKASSQSRAAGHRTARPAWNEYLTDEKQYKLSRERELVRHMQQLSASHFHARSPSSRRSTNRRDDAHSITSQSSQSCDQTHDNRSHILRAHNGSPDRMQGELAILERMLSDLEHETKRSVESEPTEYGNTSQGMSQYYDRVADDDEEGEQEEQEKDMVDAMRGVGSDEEEAEAEQERWLYDDHSDGDDESTSSELFDTDPVATICFKSLQIGMDLTQKMQKLVQELSKERKHRKKHENRIRQLEQQNRHISERCEDMESRYEQVASQVDSMRDAMIATEEAVHRLTDELIRSREHAKNNVSKRSSTPHPFIDDTSAHSLSLHHGSKRQPHGSPRNRLSASDDEHEKENIDDQRRV